MSWLDPVRAALDAVDHPCPIFFRDDDAGWADDRLLALLERFDDCALPVDVAVIPAEVTPSLVRVLRGGVGERTARIHQHGYAHVNHETLGRKCEFGASRGFEAQLADIDNGRRLLGEAFGADRVDAVFTPPWNRCTLDTPRALVELGIPVLSRDDSTGRFDLPGLIEVPVTVDWFGKRKGVPLGRADIARQIASQISGGIAAGGPVGVMLHHAVTDDAELAAVGDLLALVAGHCAAAPTTIAALTDCIRAAPARCRGMTTLGGRALP